LPSPLALLKDHLDIVGLDVALAQPAALAPEQIERRVTLPALATARRPTTHAILQVHAADPDHLG
jgi:hypothetical protein